jgi:ketosteroid isomerase-like protein
MRRGLKVRSVISMEDVTTVRQAVDRFLAGEIEPLVGLLADDVELEVAAGGDVSAGGTDSGKQAVADYFTALGGLPAFWQMDYTAAGEQVIAWGKERFTIEGCELEGACEFALVFDVDDGAVTRLLVVEDLRAFVRGVTVDQGSAPVRSSITSSMAGVSR